MAKTKKGGDEVRRDNVDLLDREQKRLAHLRGHASSNPWDHHQRFDIARLQSLARQPARGDCFFYGAGVLAFLFLAGWFSSSTAGSARSESMKVSVSWRGTGFKPKGTMKSFPCSFGSGSAPRMARHSSSIVDLGEA